MSHDDHGHEPGGHEVDQMPNGRLFKLLVGLSALTLVASIGVIQLFNLQVRGIEDERDAKPAVRLGEYRTKQAEFRKNFGRVLFLDDDGIALDAGGKGPHESVLLRMPMDDAKAAVLKDSKKFAAASRYRGWSDPSVPAGEKGAAPAAGAKGKRPAPRPGGARAPGARPGKARPTPGKARPAAPGGARPVRPAPRKPAAAPGKAPAPRPAGH